MSSTRDLGAVSCLSLVGRPVRWRGILLGRVADLLLSRDASRVFGIEVDCDAGDRRFLPLAACDLEERHVNAASPHALVETGTLPYYRDIGQSVLALVGTQLNRAGEAIGPIDDVFIGDSGDVEHLVVRGGRPPRGLSRRA